ncbi:MAG: DUF1844 domain-containing protein [Candidatus Latescibacteria bacterium]|nr:DUF1844 domain-containing protein [Candidatus Latescibacterota bacterium]
MNETTTPEFDKHDQSLMMLVLNLQTGVLVQLGKLADPQSGQLRRDLDGARLSIDLLDMLKVKTKGNAHPEVAGLLSRAALDLKLNYMDELKKDRQPDAPAAAEPAADESAPDAPAADDPAADTDGAQA